ncbi:MAG: (deoxy)nucleoside triphosphate pyrophosphohydrolase [Clostridia bacterium]|nr:(deoxy)nucleoside triphosphate pyrophosphohydrolase [Clostridia bacterium]MBR3096082.1 (deoxy)nucleoside triphosphate pyrophosphohydrolase [Clostridia bacterium]
MTQVVAALIRRGNRFLICRRPAHKTRGLLWEFVGGKVEKGETKQQALARECMEELAVEIAVGPVYMQVVHPYPDMTVELTLFDAAITAGEPQLLEHCEIAWITPQEIDNFDFCPADVEILAKLKADAAISPR